MSLVLTSELDEKLEFVFTKIIEKIRLPKIAETFIDKSQLLKWSKEALTYLSFDEKMELIAMTYEQLTPLFDTFSAGILRPETKDKRYSDLEDTLAKMGMLVKPLD